jgi:hypothetical protein
LFAGFLGTMKLSDSLHPCVTVVPRGFTVRTWRSLARPDAGPPGFRTQCFCPCRGLRPRRVRLRLTLTASTMLPSACSERVGTRDKRRFRGSILCLDIPLSTLRAYRYRYTRMTRGQCGWLDLHCLGLAPFTTVPACPGADPNAPGERRPTSTEPRKGTEPTLWAVRSTGLFGWARPCASLADHLVRQEQERRGDRDPERLGGLQVDDQLELRRLLHG